MIVTERLDLFHASVDLPAAELERLDRPVSRFAALLGVRVPESWPPDLCDRGAVEHILAKLRQAPQQAAC